MLRRPATHRSPSKRRSVKRSALTFERFEDRRMLSGTPGPDGDPNDQICEPVEVIANGQTVSGTIGNAQGIFDVDLFELSISSGLVGQEITFTVNTTDTDPTPLDTYLRLFNDAGVELEDDEDGGVEPGDSLIDFTFTSAGTYYLGVSASGNQDYSVVTGEGDDFDSFSRTGGYALTFEDTNDQIDEASTNLLDGVASGNIDLPTDVDLFRWDGVEGRSIRFEIDGDAVSGGGGLDSFLRIFDDNGNQLASDDDGAVGFRDSAFTVSFNTTDDFYIGVSSFQNTAYDAEDGTGDSTSATNTGSYTITATEVSTDPDDRIDNAIDLGNLFTDGTRLGSDSARFDGEIDTSVDVDLYKFEVGRDGSFVEIDLDTPTSPIRLIASLRLFDASGGLIELNNGANAPGEAKISPDPFIDRVLDVGTYYVGVSAATNLNYNATTGLGDTASGSIFATGSYTIDIQDRLHVDVLGDGLAGGTFADNDEFNTLREAVEFANGRSGEQTITVNPTLFEPLILGPIVNGEQTFVPTPRTITLTESELEITDDLIIDGPGASVLSISGGGDERVFLVDDEDNNSEIDVTFRGLTIRDGSSAPGPFGVVAGEAGGGIKNAENLTLDGVTVTENTTLRDIGSLPEFGGGGISHSIGTLLIKDSTISDNEAENGGGIEVVSGTVTIDNSTISDNTANDLGGGIHLVGGTVNVVNGSSIELNRAFFEGGGIFAAADTLVTIDDSTVSGNEADAGGGGIFVSDATLNVTGGSLVGGDADVVIPLESNKAADNGGGIFANAGSVVTIDNSTISGNIADNGGGVFISDGTLDVQNGSTLGGDTEAEGNKATFGGGAIFAQSDAVVTIDASTVSANTADVDGGGIAMLGGTLNIRNGSTLGGDTAAEGNKATDDGGAIFAQSDAVVTIDASTVSGNTADDNGGGVFMFSGTLNIQNGSTLGGDGAAEGNKATNNGGAIFAQSDAVVTIDASTVSGNIADDNGGGVVILSGTLNIQNGSTLGGDTAAEGNQGNLGGAIFAQTTTVVTIDRSTIAGNTARIDGGGIYRANATGSTTITNSTFSGNLAEDDAGGLQVDGPTVIRNSTFTGNRADSDGNGTGAQGGIFTPAGQLTMHNTIVAGNFKGTGTTPSDLDTGNLVASSSHNLIGSAVGGSGGLTDGAGGNIVGVGGSGTIPTSTILNMTLTDNGGSTLTHALVAGSPAIGAGDNVQAAGLTTDQRGSGFARVQAAIVDIGAIESATEPLSLVVNTTSDSDNDLDGVTSLREAIDFANDPTAGTGSNGDADGVDGVLDTITFAPSLNNSMILLTGTQLSVTDSVSIEGPGAGLLTISTSTSSPNSRIFSLGSTNAATYTISGLTLDRGIVPRGLEANPETGGAIRLNNNGDTLILDSSVIQNSASNGGGAIFVGGTGTELRVINSTLTDNEANFSGSAILTAGSTETLIVNSTISGNTSLANSGAVFQQTAGSDDATLSLVNATVASNTGLGVQGFSSGGDNTILLANTIVADNSSGSLAASSGVVFDSLGGNLLNNSPGIFTAAANDQVNTDPLLGPLTNNGGSTPTHALPDGSPAINKGDNARTTVTGLGALAFDQRGAGFDRIKFGTVDVGAFESDFDVAATAPVITGTQRDEGGVLARPDLIFGYSVFFDQDVSVAQDDLSIFNQTTGTSVDTSSLTLGYSATTNTATWTFGSLALDPAFYTFEVSSNISGVVGGLNLSANNVEEVYVALPGDANLDGQVDVLGDAAILVNNLGTTSGAVWAEGNFNADGTVDVLGDAAILVNRLGQSVVPVATASQSLRSPAFSTSIGTTSEVELSFPQPAAERGEAALVGPLASLSLAGSQTLDAAFAANDWLI